MINHIVYQYKQQNKSHDPELLRIKRGGAGSCVSEAWRCVVGLNVIAAVVVMWSSSEVPR